MENPELIQPNRPYFVPRSVLRYSLCKFPHAFVGGEPNYVFAFLTGAKYRCKNVPLRKSGLGAIVNND